MSSTHSIQPPSPGSAKTTLWYTRCPVPTAFSVALQTGLLAAEFESDPSVNFRSLGESPDRSVHQSHFLHNLENSFRHGGNVPAIYARAAGAETRLIGLSWLPTPHPIVALPESGIRTVSDLRGKRLLVLRRPGEPIDFWRATSLRIYETALATAGLTLKDVQLVEIDVERPFIDKERDGATRTASLWGARARLIHLRDFIFPLARGEVDAAPGQTWFGVQLAAYADGNVVFDPSTLPDPVARANNALPEALTVSARLVEENRALVVRVVSRLLEAAEWARNHHRETVAIIAREQGVAEELVELTYGNAVSTEFDLDFATEKVAAIASQKQFLLRHGFIQRDFDLNEWIEPRILGEARAALSKRNNAPLFDSRHSLPSHAA